MSILIFRSVIGRSVAIVLFIFITVQTVSEREGELPWSPLKFCLGIISLSVDYKPSYPAIHQITHSGSKSASAIKNIARQPEVD